jgi:leucyl/phenylalanyl-tRNA--protein transferase
MATVVSRGGVLSLEREPVSREAVIAEPQFHEDFSATLRRVFLGLLYPLRLNRLRILPLVILLTVELMVEPGMANRRFEDPKYRGWQGLVGVSQNLSCQAILENYRRGIFPFCHVGPMKWWCPAERAVLDPREAHIEKNIRRLIRQGKYRITFDMDFAGVMQACAAPRTGKTPLTWITPRVMRAFWALHREGHAHSVEVWDGEGRLVGGLYGLAIGGVFFGESQFSRVRDASKVAVAALHCHLAHWGFALRDAKWPTDHLASLGFRTMGREEFLEALKEHASKPGHIGRWSIDPSLDVAAWQTKA